MQQLLTFSWIYVDIRFCKIIKGEKKQDGEQLALTVPFHVKKKDTVYVCGMYILYFYISKMLWKIYKKLLIVIASRYWGGYSSQSFK